MANKLLIAKLKFLQRWRSRGTDSLSGLGFQLLVIGALIREIIAIRKITVQKSKVESVRNADRMNQRYECLMGIHRGVYTAKPPVSVWVPRLFLDAEMAIFLKLTPMVRFPNRTDVECVSNYGIYYNIRLYLLKDVVKPSFTLSGFRER